MISRILGDNFSSVFFYAAEHLKKAEFFCASEDIIVNEQKLAKLHLTHQIKCTKTDQDHRAYGILKLIFHYRAAKEPHDEPSALFYSILLLDHKI